MQSYKYQENSLKNKLKSPEELGFMEYYMLPEGDEFDYVYRPGDDSFLMLSVLKDELPGFSLHSVICEIGSGSGIISAHLNRWLLEAGKEPLVHYSTDISLDACLLSQKYYTQYGLRIEQLCTSLTKGIRVLPEIIICNPPYVPTDPEEKESELKYLQKNLQKRVTEQVRKRSPDTNMIAYSYMGGLEGLDTTRQLIQHVSWQCKIYLIIMGEEGLQTISEELQKGKLTHSNIKHHHIEVLQLYRKMNEELYVVLISLN